MDFVLLFALKWFEMALKGRDDLVCILFMWVYFRLKLLVSELVQEDMHHCLYRARRVVIYTASC